MCERSRSRREFIVEDRVGNLGGTLELSKCRAVADVFVVRLPERNIFVLFSTDKRYVFRRENELSEKIHSGQDYHEIVTAIMMFYPTKREKLTGKRAGRNVV